MRLTVRRMPRQEEIAAHLAACREYARERLSAIPDLQFIGPASAPHILSVSLPVYPSQNIVSELDSKEIFISAGSACHRGRPSHVFAALKLPKALLDGALRVSFSYDTSREDVDALMDGLKGAKEQLFTTLS